MCTSIAEVIASWIFSIQLQIDPENLKFPITATNFGVAKFEAVGFEIFSSWPIQSMKQVPGQWR